MDLHGRLLQLHQRSYLNSRSIGQPGKVTTVATTYTAANTDTDIHLTVSSSYVITLPLAEKRQIKNFIKTDSNLNSCEISIAGSDTINGLSSVKMHQQYERLTLESDGGTNWYVTDFQAPREEFTPTLTIQDFVTAVSNVKSYFQKESHNHCRVWFRHSCTTTSSPNDFNVYRSTQPISVTFSGGVDSDAVGTFGCLLFGSTDYSDHGVVRASGGNTFVTHTFRPGVNNTYSVHGEYVYLIL